MGAGGAILEPGHPLLLEAVGPFAARARANAYGFTGGLRRLPADNHFGQPLSTVRCQAGILMDVHSALPQGTLTSRQHQLPRPEPDGQPIESSHLEPGEPEAELAQLLARPGVVGLGVGARLIHDVEVEAAPAF